MTSNSFEAPRAVRAPIQASAKWVVVIAVTSVVAFQVTLAVALTPSVRLPVMWSTVVTFAGSFGVGMSWRTGDHRRRVGRWARTQLLPRSAIDAEALVSRQPTRPLTRWRQASSAVAALLAQAVVLATAVPARQDEAAAPLAFVSIGISLLCAHLGSYLRPVD